MKNFKEFEGKQLDACIKEACAYFDCPREKLEIEIIQNAKTGIFGIVGARKAKLRARRIQLPEKALNFLENNSVTDSIKNSLKIKTSQDRSTRSLIKKSSFASERTPQKKAVHPTPVQQSDQNPLGENLEDNFFEEKNDFPESRLEDLPADEVIKLTCDTVSRLLTPIAGKEIKATAEIAHGRVRVNVQWEGDAGLLIGRAGQTLASLQYIASRILSHVMNAGVRVQLEIGQYTSKQDEKLKERAHMLAEKARQTGRSWSTPPLSSYHRRIIHMELQNEPGIITRSFGDGIMKKVIIAPRHSADSAS